MELPTNKEFEPVDKKDDIYTIEEFRENVDCGGFIDDDGHGNWSDGKVKLREWDDNVYPSSFAFDHLSHPWATHVVWYNR